MGNLGKRANLSRIGRLIGSLCSRYAGRYAVVMQSLCSRYAVVMQSLCNRYAGPYSLCRGSPMHACITKLPLRESQKHRQPRTLLGDSQRGFKGLIVNKPVRLSILVEPGM